MENSDSDDEDESTAMVQNQMDRLVREEDFYRFVNNLNDEDYKLMRDNDLLGNPGESTEEELLRRLQQLKENPLQNVHENTGGGDTSDDESSAQSLLNWLLSSEETDESVTSEHTEHQSCRELSQVSPNNDFTFNSETYFHLNNDNSNLENEYEPPTRLPRGENIENRQSHVENLCSESTFTRPSRSEQSITEALSEVPLTRGQRRARSRSPDHRRTRARSENWSPPHSTSEIFQRHYQGASSPTIEQPLVNERTTVTIESWSPPHSMSEVFQRLHQGDSSPTSEQPLVNERTTVTIESWSPACSMSEVFRRFHQDASSPTSEQPLVNERTTVTIENWSPPHSMSEVFQRRHQGASSPTIEQPLVNERTTVTIESWSPACSMSEVFQRRHQGASSPTIEQPLVNERTTVTIESWSPVCSMSEVFQRFHQDASSPTSEQPVVNATERLTRTQLQETLRQQITGHDLQNRDLFATPRTRNRESPVQRESSQDTTRGDVSHRLRQISPTIFLDSELARVHPGAYSESESIASRTQITSETSINTFTLESEQGGPRPMFSYSEQADMRAHVSTISIPIHTTLNTGLNDTTSVATQSNPWQAMTDFSDLSNLMNNDNDLEPCVSPSSQNVEKRESPTGRESCDSRSSGANSDSDHDSHSPSALISSSNSSYRSPFNSSPTSDSSSSDEDPYGNSLMFETPDERSLSPVSFSQTRQHSRSMSPVSFDDSDSWTSLDLDQFFLVSDDQNHSTGLTREQIDNLTVRSFGKNEVLKSCSICIMEYTEGNRLRVLPCSHEYHIHCIDRWLADNSTCPVCRGKVVDSGEGENSN
ncbi:hypothetical protein mRhiFer1_007951 [Rhinolophus ferrumequinum]|uniref:RING-type E3 ubiquitin transferase n=1 Tax=Rhinolophus ferrumequinum TaxID=59479 RepID=A0A7J8AW15_RHIFE|nr:hypothetical protein mRhiFer1_007951 [Rhinolophus ferrumequinum]